jgi:hypothetical protein
MQQPGETGILIGHGMESVGFSLKKRDIASPFVGEM